MSIGDNFTVSYGQLKGITVQEGEHVSEGQVIGKIADPTKYYSMEGSNLYYQVKENKDSVNPMVLLSEEVSFLFCHGRRDEYGSSI